MENFETNFDTIANSPEKEKYGSNVEIVLKFIRHGERDKENNLTDIGREITHQKAQESGIIKTDFDAVKAIGSNVGPKSKIGMGRSLETAHIYAHVRSPKICKLSTHGIMDKERSYPYAQISSQQGS